MARPMVNKLMEIRFEWSTLLCIERKKSIVCHIHDPNSNFFAVPSEEKATDIAQKNLLKSSHSHYLSRKKSQKKNVSFPFSIRVRMQVYNIFKRACT